MKVWIVWEHYCKCFDIVAEETRTLIGVYASEEAAYCAVEDFAAAQTDKDITYHYEEQEVRA